MRSLSLEGRKSVRLPRKGRVGHGHGLFIKTGPNDSWLPPHNCLDTKVNTFVFNKLPVTVTVTVTKRISAARVRRVAPALYCREGWLQKMISRPPHTT